MPSFSRTRLLVAVAVLAGVSAQAGAVMAQAAATPTPKSVTVRVTNPLATTRTGETVELRLAQLASAFDARQTRQICVAEDAGGRELLSQLVDEDGDGQPDLLVFQADFEASGAGEFEVRSCPRGKPRREDFRVYGRFVRERHDDFAWENDRVAFRVYGPALETFAGEPLTSSTVDAWSKGTRRLVLNDWYMVDDYHEDHGEGGDFYSAGRSRGCGGSGLMAGGKLNVSRNFRESRVLASGPIRLVFELSYPVWENGFPAREKKRVTLDAGSQFNRFDSVVELQGVSGAQPAIGIKQGKGASSRVDREHGFVRTWEFQGNYGDGGWLGCAVVVDPARIAEVTELDGNHLVVLKADGTSATWYAGSGWDRSGLFDGAESWERHVAQFAARVAAPLKVELVK